MHGAALGHGHGIMELAVRGTASQLQIRHPIFGRAAEMDTEEVELA